MNNTISSMLNTQIQKEFESAYIYLGFAAYFDSVGMKGFAHWYKVQAQEELKHGKKIYNYLNDKNVEINLLEIPAPKEKIETTIDALEMGLQHEQYITALINNIYSEAEKQHDFDTKNFLEWFISEQHEEEVNAESLLESYNVFGVSPEGMYFLDRELLQRKAA